MSINKELLVRFNSILSSGKSIDDVLCEEDGPEVMYHLSPVGEALLSWYEFNPQATLLEVDARYGSLTGLFCNKVSHVVSLQSDREVADFISERYRSYSNLEVICGNVNDISGRTFDYITLIGTTIDSDLINKISTLLKEDGKLIVSVNNEFSVRHWAGLEDENGYSISLLKTMFNSAGLKYQSVYYPYPNYNLPLQIFSTGRLPGADEINNHTQSFEDNQIVFHDVASSSYKLIKSGEYEGYVNSYLVFAGKTDNVNSAMVYFKQNYFRNPRYRLNTSIYNSDGLVIKSPFDEISSEHVDRMVRNHDSLQDIYSKVKVVSCSITPKGLSFPIVRGNTLLSDLDINNSSTEEIIRAVQSAIDIIFDFKTSSTDFKETEEFCNLFPGCHVNNDEPAYEITNIDSNFDNFLDDGSNVWCIDYEWVVYFPVPVNFVKFRNLLYFYTKHVAALSSRISLEDFYKAFGIDSDRVDLYMKMEDCFQCNVLGQNRKYMYVSKYERQTKPYQIAINEIKEEKTLEINRIASEYEAVIAQLKSDIEKQNSSISELRNSVDEQIKANNELQHSVETLNVIVADRDQTIQKLFRAIKNTIYRVKYFVEEFKKNKENGDK